MLEAAGREVQPTVTDHERDIHRRQADQVTTVTAFSFCSPSFIRRIGDDRAPGLLTPYIEVRYL